MVVVVVKLFPQGFAKHNGFRTEDKLEGEGIPTHGLVNIDVSWVLSLPFYLYVEPWGRNLE